MLSCFNILPMSGYAVLYLYLAHVTLATLSGINILHMPGYAVLY